MDYDGNGVEDISDPVGSLSFLFLGGRPPANGAGCLYESCESTNCSA
jgi:hypothetical protein